MSLERTQIKTTKTSSGSRATRRSKSCNVKSIFLSSKLKLVVLPNFNYSSGSSFIISSYLALCSQMRRGFYLIESIKSSVGSLGRENGPLASLCSKREPSNIGNFRHTFIFFFGSAFEYLN
jgi:hypothetical protein